MKPTYAIQDEDITPIALTKSATAHEKLGQADKATELRARLKEKFPSYKPGGILPGLPETEELHGGGESSGVEPFNAASMLGGGLRSLDEETRYLHVAAHSLLRRPA